MNQFTQVSATDILCLPVEEGVRLHMLGYLEQAGHAAQRLQNADDNDALRRFRTALRRLQTLVRAYQACLRPGVDKAFDKELDVITQACGPARNVQVQLAWLSCRQAMLRAHEMPGYRWLHARLMRRLEKEQRSLRRRVLPAFALLQARLQVCLQAPYVRSGESFALYSRAVVADAAARFIEDLRSVLSKDGNGRDRHEARREGKHLRYLLEPLTSMWAQSASVMTQLKRCQDVLGELNDLRMLSRQLRRCAEDAGAERLRLLIELSLKRAPDDPQLEAVRQDDERAGLMALAREVHERRQDLRLRLEALLEDDALIPVITDLQEAVIQLPESARRLNSASNA